MKDYIFIRENKIDGAIECYKRHRDPYKENGTYMLIYSTGYIISSRIHKTKYTNNYTIEYVREKGGLIIKEYDNEEKMLEENIADFL